MDAHCLVLQNVDELFDREEFSACIDACWPDFFNSGVFVYKPSHETFKKLFEFVSKIGRNVGDQGLLNSYFTGWCNSESSRRLPFYYNTTITASNSLAQKFETGVKIGI